MSSSRSYIITLVFFGVFLVVSTLQLGKSRTTINVLEKKKASASLMAPTAPNRLANELLEVAPIPSVQSLSSAKPDSSDVLVVVEQ